MKFDMCRNEFARKGEKTSEKRGERKRKRKRKKLVVFRFGHFLSSFPQLTQCFPLFAPCRHHHFASVVEIS